jgi:ribosomal protein S18 acetylase RimI-like enzyme
VDALPARYRAEIVDPRAAFALSVWSWRVGAIGLYEKLGFAVVDSWDERADLVCMERAVRPTSTE